jgi:hypothetical protein
MNDIGPDLREDLLESSGCLEVGPRSDGSNQLRDEDDFQICVVVLVEQRAFGSKARTSDKRHIVSKIPNKI